MHFKPIDENSLRHLFSSELGEKVLKISYLGPVMNGQVIQGSPDCLVVDKNTNPFSIKRCEFKFEPANINEFQHNGRFDIAIIWGLGGGMTLPRLEAGLLQQNGCNQIIALNQIIEFQDLPDYNIPVGQDIQNVSDIHGIMIRNRFETAYIAYCFALAYPQQLHLQRIKEHLRLNFPGFARIHRNGQHNVIIGLANRHNPIIENTHGEYYIWNHARNLTLATQIIRDSILRNFRRALPNPAIIQQLI